ncbi:MAG: DUF2341 domain-containing protein, partial [Candidatus Thermoplasmatota archaeon]
LDGATGNRLWKLTGLSGTSFYSTPLVFDFEGYGYPYIYAPIQDVDEPLVGSLNKISHDGKLLKSVWAYRPCAGGLALVDSTYDGNFQIIMGDRTPPGVGIASFDPDNLSMNWNQPYLQMNSGITPIADATNDGTQEVIVAMQNLPQGFTVLGPTGNIIKRETGIEMGGHGLSATVHDFDDDGYLEMIFACSYSSSYFDLVVWQLHPTYWGEEQRFSAGLLRFSPQLVDVTGDGVLEMVACSKTAIQIYNKTYNKIYEVSGLSSELMYPTCNDIDGDGLFELVISSSAGKIYAFDTFSPVPDPAPRSEVEFYSEYRRGVAEYVERPGPKHPMQRDINPANGSVHITPNPVLSAHCWDYQWDEFNVTFRTNASGSWQDIITYTDIGRYPNQTSTGFSWGTYTATPTHMNQPNTKYYWSIYAEDKNGNTIERFFQFTTADIVPFITNPVPTDGAQGIPLNLSSLKFNLTDLQNDPMDWTVETSPDVGSGYGSDVGNGQYTVAVSGLAFNTTYTWFVNATDGVNWRNETFMFATRPTLGVWWDPSWPLRREIIIDNTQVVGSHVNFPLLVKTSPGDPIQEQAQADGDDIVFTDYLGNQLSHEIEHYDGTTGELIVWVNIPVLSSTELTILYLYYGNPSCGSQQNPAGTWNTNYLMVQHLHETTGTHYDATVNNNDGTPVGGVLQNTSGAINGGDAFDGVDDYIDLAGTTQLNTRDVTVSAWMRTIKDTTDMRIVVGGATYTYKWHLIMDDGHLMMTNNTVAGANLRSTQLFNDGVWHYVVGTRNPLRLYVDGQMVSAQPIDESWSLDGGAKIAAKSSTQYFFNGSIDEVRVSQVVRSADWVATEYRNQRDPLLFSSIGSEERGSPVVSDESPVDGAVGVVVNPLLSVAVFDPQMELMDVWFRTNATGGWSTIGSNMSVGAGVYSQKPSVLYRYLTSYYWSVNCTDGVFWVNRTFSFTTRSAPGAWWNSSWLYRKEVVIDSARVAGNLSFFPVLVTLSADGDLAVHAQDDGDDLVFTDNLGTRLSHEIQMFDGVTGQLVAWVNVPVLSDVMNTSLFLYYGNMVCESQEDPAGVWDDDFVAVWHLDENPGVVGTGGITDSTTYVNHGTPLGGMDSADHVAGKIGYAIDFDGTNDVIRIDGSNVVGHSLDFTSDPFTVEAWFRIRTTSDPGTLVSKRDGTTLDQYQFYLQPTLRLRANAEYGGVSDTLTTNTWYYGAVVINNTNWPEIFRNAVQRTWVDYAGSRPYNFIHRNVNVSIGARWESYPTAAFPFKGIIDEVRISRTDRSSDWLLTCYNNQNDPSTFYSVMAEEEAPFENQPPVAAFVFSPSDPTTETLVYCNSTSYDIDGVIVNWSWNFDDGQQGYGEFVTHEYTIPGVYSVNLTVMDEDSASASVEHIVEVEATGIIWNATLVLSETGGMMDLVGFGEATDASDGQDSYDVPKPGTPPTMPYLVGWFDAGLSEPYNRLWWDYRAYPDSYKVWNLSVLWMPVDYASPTMVTLSWNSSELIDAEYGMVTLINLASGATVDMRSTESYVFNASAVVPHEFLIIGSSEMELPVTNLTTAWNLVSVPFNLPVMKSELRVRWNDSEYSWAEAVSAGLVLNFVYEWNRSMQYYGLSDGLMPGYGYWMYAYQNCSVFMVSTMIPSETDVITGLLTQWNLVGLPDDDVVPNQALVVRYDGVDYNWTQATTSNNPTGSPLVLGFIYDWNRSGQFYQFSDSLVAGYAYWMYAYQNCVLRKGGV